MLCGKELLQYSTRCLQLLLGRSCIVVMGSSCEHYNWTVVVNMTDKIQIVAIHCDAASMYLQDSGQELRAPMDDALTALLRDGYLFVASK